MSPVVAASIPGIDTGVYSSLRHPPGLTVRLSSSDPVATQPKSDSPEGIGTLVALAANNARPTEVLRELPGLFNTHRTLPLKISAGNHAGEVVSTFLAALDSYCSRRLGSLSGSTTQDIVALAKIAELTQYDDYRLWNEILDEVGQRNKTFQQSSFDLKQLTHIFGAMYELNYCDFSRVEALAIAVDVALERATVKPTGRSPEATLRVDGSTFADLSRLVCVFAHAVAFMPSHSGQLRDSTISILNKLFSDETSRAKIAHPSAAPIIKAAIVVGFDILQILKAVEQPAVDQQKVPSRFTVLRDLNIPTAQMPQSDTEKLFRDAATMFLRNKAVVSSPAFFGRVATPDFIIHLDGRFLFVEQDGNCGHFIRGDENRPCGRDILSNQFYRCLGDLYGFGVQVVRIVPSDAVRARTLAKKWESSPRSLQGSVRPGVDKILQQIEVATDRLRDLRVQRADDSRTLGIAQAMVEAEQKLKELQGRLKLAAYWTVLKEKITSTDSRGSDHRQKRGTSEHIRRDEGHVDLPPPRIGKPR